MTASRDPQKQKLPATKRPAKKSNSVSIAMPATAPSSSSLSSLLRRRYAKEPSIPMPQGIRPMLATRTETPFSDPSWQFELKWDGYRALAYTSDGTVSLRSRNQVSLTQTYEPITAALKQWGVPAVLDGEIVVLNEEGHADFEALQQWGVAGEGMLHYYVFDLLWLDGIDIRNKPLSERRALLKQVLPDGGPIRYSDSIDEAGTELFALAQQSGIEGIIAKRKDSLYDEGKRSASWLKIKAEQRDEAIICGYTKKAGTDRNFSSLVLGTYEGGQLEYIGSVGTGWNRTDQQLLLEKMQALRRAKPPFPKAPKLADEVFWIHPKMICEVQYTERTREGVLRHPSFKGLRSDKNAEDLNPEQNALLLAPGLQEAIVDVSGQAIKLTNLDKLFWIQEKISKGDLLNYYHAMAPYILPYMEHRPQSLNRHPNGIAGKSFYQKNMAGRLEKWLHTFRRVSQASMLPKYFLVCEDEAHLLYMVNLGCIELNPWHSTVAMPDHPTWCVIDLDPGDIAFSKVVETANQVHALLESIGVVSFPKTSGSTGIHIYIPLGQRYSYEQSKQFAELIARIVHAELPGFTSIERSPQKRPDKIYIDYLQNRPIQTICAAYSVRPKPGATVSAPLHWTEVNNKLKIENFTMQNMTARVRSEGDLFSGVLERGIDLHHALQQLTRLYETH